MHPLQTMSNPEFHTKKQWLVDLSHETMINPLWKAPVLRAHLISHPTKWNTPRTSVLSVRTSRFSLPRSLITWWMEKELVCETTYHSQFFGTYIYTYISCVYIYIYMHMYICILSVYHMYISCVYILWIYFVYISCVNILWIYLVYISLQGCIYIH